MTRRFLSPVEASLLAALCVPAILQAAAAKVTCATCHRQEAQFQPQSAMGIGLELPAKQQVLEAHPKLSFEANGYRYDIERKSGISIYTVSDGSGKLSLPIQYAFGVHNLTFVFEYQGHYYESLVTYYEPIQGLGITIGDSRVQPHNLVEAMGRRTSDHEIVDCFGCHASNAVSRGKLTLPTMQPGLTCEHCHTGAEAHLEAMSSGKPAPLPRKLGEMAAEEMSGFCGQCHRTWESVVGQHLFGQKNVRFQPYRLAISQCFLGDDMRIRCTACHNPHVDLDRDDSHYDHACLACHVGKTATVANAVTHKSCPVADKNCVTCHMPKVPAPGVPSIFSDHNIRIAHAGDPYPE